MTGPWRRLRIGPAALFALGYAAPWAPVSVSPTLACADGDALAVYDALEAPIDEGRDTPADHEFGCASVFKSQDDDGLTLARTAITGRFIQQQGAARVVSTVWPQERSIAVRAIQSSEAEQPRGCLRRST